MFQIAYLSGNSIPLKEVSCTLTEKVIEYHTQ